MAKNKFKSREYRRDAKRIANAMEEKFGKITSEDDFEKKLSKYLNGKVKDPDGDFLPKLKSEYTHKVGSFKPPTDKEKDLKARERITKKVPDVKYVFTGSQKGSKKVQEAYFDDKQNRYRNRKGQFVKKV